MVNRSISQICLRLFRQLGSALLLPILTAPCHAAPSTYEVDPVARAVMQLPAPAVQRYPARDGNLLAYRFFPIAADAKPPDVVAILLHGSSGSSLNMTVLGQALAQSGVPDFAPDVRGQGLSGRPGDIDYIGQLDDDLVDFVGVVRHAFPAARLVLVGHSAGGGFALRIAGEAAGRHFSRFVLLAPVLGRLSPVNRPGSGWVRPNVARIVLLRALNQVGITRFNGETAVSFNLPPDAEAFGLTPSWSYRMLNNYGPSGQLQLFCRAGYLIDAERAAAPIVVIAGAADQQMLADQYAAAFAGLTHPVSVELAEGVNHMGVVSDARAVPLIVRAIKAAADGPPD